MKSERKRQFLTVLAGAIAIGIVPAFNQPSYAQGTTFFCGVILGVIN